MMFQIAQLNAPEMTWWLVGLGAFSVLLNQLFELWRNLTGAGKRNSLDSKLATLEGLVERNREYNAELLRHQTEELNVKIIALSAQIEAVLSLLLTEDRRALLSQRKQP